MRARTIWLKVHLYLALWLGAFIAILGLTGSLLVYHPEIDRLINPDLRPPASSASHIDLDAVANAVQRQVGQPPGLIRMPTRDYAAYIVEYFDPQTEQFHIATVDAATGDVLGNRVWGRTFITFLFDVHTKLLMGEPGLTFVGWLGILLIVSAITGIYLWWPRGKAWKQAFLFRRTRGALPFNFELHRISGFYLTIILVIVAVSGVSITLPTLFVEAVQIFAPVTPEPEDISSAPASESARPIALGRVHEIFRDHAPGARLTALVLPDDPQDSISIRFVDPAEPDNYYGQSALWVDQYTGEILKSHVYSELPRADRFLAAQLPLHDGQYLGAVGRILVFLSGVVTVVLYATGLYLWWKRRRRRVSPAAGNASLASPS